MLYRTFEIVTFDLTLNACSLIDQFAVMSPEKCDVIFKTIGMHASNKLYKSGALISYSRISAWNWYIYRREHPRYAYMGDLASE